MEGESAKPGVEWTVTKLQNMCTKMFCALCGIPEESPEAALLRNFISIEQNLHERVFALWIVITDRLLAAYKQDPCTFGKMLYMLPNVMELAFLSTDVIPFFYEHFLTDDVRDELRLLMGEEEKLSAEEKQARKKQNEEFVNAVKLFGATLKTFDLDKVEIETFRLMRNILWEYIKMFWHKYHNFLYEDDTQPWELYSIESDEESEMEEYIPVELKKGCMQNLGMQIHILSSLHNGGQPLRELQDPLRPFQRELIFTSQQLRECRAHQRRIQEHNDDDDEHTDEQRPTIEKDVGERPGEQQGSGCGPESCDGVSTEQHAVATESPDDAGRTVRQEETGGGSGGGEEEGSQGEGNNLQQGQEECVVQPSFFFGKF